MAGEDPRAEATSDSPAASDTTKVITRKPRQKPLVFISHRTADEPIASQLADWITASCAGQVDVFQSSHGLRGASIARSITEEIREAVADAAVMIVIYTEEDADWAWVMFEMGIAMDPTTPVTNVVVLQCTEDYPRVLTEFRRVHITQEADRLAFSKQFLTTPFFPTHNQFVVAATPEDGYAKERTSDLWNRLKDHVPIFPRRTDWRPHPVLTIDVPLRGRPTESMAVEKWLEMLEAVVRDDGRVFEEREISGVFVAATLVGRSLAEMVALLAAAQQEAWIEALIREIAWCMAELRPQKAIDRFKSVAGVEFQPVLTRIQEKWFNRVARFEVNLLPVGVISGPGT